MAKLGGGVDELQVNLLKGPPFGLHQQGLWAERRGLVRKDRPLPAPSHLTGRRTGSKPEPACCGNQAASPHTQPIVWQAASQELPPPCAVSRAATKLGQTGISSSQDFKDQVKGAAAAPFL